MSELTVIIHDEKIVPGAGPGGSGRPMRSVTLDGELVGYLVWRDYAREGGVFESFMPDANSALMRNTDPELLALELAIRRLRNIGGRNRPSTASV